MTSTQAASLVVIDSDRGCWLIRIIGVRERLLLVVVLLECICRHGIQPHERLVRIPAVRMQLKSALQYSP